MIVEAEAGRNGSARGGAAVALRMKTSPVLRFFLAYTVAWLVGAGAIGAVYGWNGASFLFRDDGLFQHFTAFNYVCDFLGGMLAGEGAPLFDFTIGQGADTLTTLAGYDFCDPISWAAALLIPLDRMGRYLVMVFAKFYLIGASFGIYCFCTGRRDTAAVFYGAIAYTFSGAMLFTFMRHPNFISWAYCLPLMLAGIERYARDGRRPLLVAAVALNAVANYYTLYMNVVVSVAYVMGMCIARWWRERTGSVALKCLRQALGIAGWMLFGLALAAVVLVPVAYAFTQSARVGVATGYTASWWHYPANFYGRLATLLFAEGASTGYYTHIGLNAVAAAALPFLFVRKGSGFLKACLAVSFLALCIPLAGRMMNGMGYASNRFSYVFAFFVSVAIVQALPLMRRGSRRDWAIAGGAVLAYLCACAIALGMKWQIEVAIAVAAIACALAVLAAARFRADRAFPRIACGLVLACACVQACVAYAPQGGGYVGDYFAANDIEPSLRDSLSAVDAESLGAEGFFRTERGETNRNAPLLAGANGTQIWWSALSRGMSEYYTGLGLDSLNQNCDFRGLDNRPGLLAIADVRYYTCRPGDADAAPAGFSRVEGVAGPYSVFESNTPDVLGVVYEGCIARSEYDSLDAVRKEQALLQSAVADEAPGGVPRADIATRGEVLPYTVAGASKAKLTDTSLKLEGKDGLVELSVDVPHGCELYLRMPGIDFAHAKNPANAILDVKRTAGDFSVSKWAQLSNARNNWPVFRDELVYDLGSGAPGANTVYLSGSKGYEVGFDRLEIVAVPTDFLQGLIGDRTSGAMRDVRVGADIVQGTVSTQSGGVLQLSIPYSVGWQAYVDGDPAETFASGVMYTGIAVSPGEHAVELRYRTPYLREGVLISLAALAAATILAFRKPIASRVRRALRTEH